MRTKSPHIIIIGAGLIGLSTADSLLNAGARVTVIDQAHAPMQGTSFSNSGMLHPSQAYPWGFEGNDAAAMSAAKDVFDLAKRSTALTLKRREALGLPERPSGTQKIFESQDARDEACARYDALGVSYKCLVVGAELGERFALSFPEDHSGNAFDCGMAMAQDLAARGAVFMTGRAARPHMKSGRVIGVDIGNEFLASDHVVLAAALHSEILARELEINIPMRNEVGFAVNFVRPENMFLPGVPVMHAGSYSALTVFDNVVRLSGTVGQDTAQTLLETWNGIAPKVIRALGPPIGPAWRGMRPMSQAGRPYIGPTAIESLWVNTGHGHMGWTLCTGSGYLLADMIKRGTEDPRFKLP